MILTLFIGNEVKGARRWIQLGGFSIQASEFIKPAFYNSRGVAVRGT